jgi:hypothetical protein
MRLGTKSLLFGVHQFIFHPLFVLLAWNKLYNSFPNPKELLCIVVHDWGYFNSPNMDGPEGTLHPKRSADLIRFLGDEYYYLVLYHSRHYANIDKVLPSKLCWADKYSYKYDPIWFYVIRSNLSGEIKEYRNLPHNREFIGSDGEWYSNAQKVYIDLALSKTNQK